MEQLNNNLRKFHSFATKLKYHGDFDADRMRVGDCYALLPICNHVLLNSSPTLAQEIANMGIELYGVSDGKFVEGFYKVMRDILDYNPKVKLQQFLTSTGFAEKKLSLMADVLQIIHDKYSLRAKPKVVAASRLYSSSSNSVVNGRVEKNLPEKISSSKPVSASRTERSYASSVRDINGTSMGTPSINSIDIIDVGAESNYRDRVDARGSAAYGSAFHHVPTRPFVESHVSQESTNPAYLSSTTNGHYSQYHVEVADQYREAMKLASERHVELMEKLTGMDRKMDKLEGLIHKLENKQADLELQMRKVQSAPSSSSAESPSKVIDNLVARTSLIETKLSLLESTNSAIYKDDYFPSKTKSYDLPAPSRSTNTHHQLTLSSYGNPSTIPALDNRNMNDSYTSSHNSSKLTKTDYRHSNHIALPSSSAAVSDSMKQKETEPDYTIQNLSRSFKNIQNEVRLGMGDVPDVTETSTVAPVDIGANVTSNSLLATSGVVPNLDMSLKDRSIVLSSSELKEQKARIEALFEETTSALRLPLSNKENMEVAAPENSPVVDES